MAGGVVLAAAVLGGCEYADGEPLPGPGTASLPQAAAPRTISAEEAERQAELMAEVESLMDLPVDVSVLGVTGEMRDGAGINSSGLLREAGTYQVRAVCTSGPGAVVTVRQHGALLLSQRITCGTPYDAVVDLASGQVSAGLEPIGGAGLVGGGVRFGAPQDFSDSGAAG
jgi:hypothetical protein